MFKHIAQQKEQQVVLLASIAKMQADMTSQQLQFERRRRRLCKSMNWRHCGKNTTDGFPLPWTPHQTALHYLQISMKIFSENHLSKSAVKYITKFKNERASTEKLKELNWEIKHRTKLKNERASAEKLKELNWGRLECVQLLDSDNKFILHAKKKKKKWCIFKTEC